MSEEPKNTLVSHLEALRRTLLRCLAVTALLVPFGIWVAPRAVAWLTRWCFPGGEDLHYFSPLEVFVVHIKLGAAIALAAAYPWNAIQLWNFVLPALRRGERAFGRWIVFSSLLFFSGAAFCVGAILPLLMRFATGFRTDRLAPVIGIENFLDLAGWLTLAFGVMFQTPIAVMLAVRFGVVGRDALAAKRPYVVAAILVVAALLTPPDVLSQVLLALPTYLLFELGLLLARRK